MPTTTNTTAKAQAASEKAAPKRKVTAAKKADVPEDAPGAASVPGQTVIDDYIHRVIVTDGDNVTDDFDVFEYALAHKINVLIEGPTGCGKTMSARAFAASKGMPFFALSSNVGVDPSQLFGRMIPTEDGHFRWQDGPVTEMLRNGGVLVIDEINFMPERVSTVLFPVLDARRSTNLVDHQNELVVAHDNLLIIAGMNPNYAGTRTLNAALRNRFAIQMQWDYDLEQENQLVGSPTLMTVVGQLRASGEIRTPVSTNMLQEIERLAKSSLGPSFAVQNFIAHFDVQTEQTFVTTVLDTQRDALVRELGGGIADDDDEWNADDWDLAVNGTVDNPNPINHPDWAPHMGVYVGTPNAETAKLTVGTWSLRDDDNTQYEDEEVAAK